jgi:cytochrome c oxidase cbb3-type subunit 3
MSESLRKDPIQGQIIHIYDGIEEADNALPRWWLVTFFATAIFGVFYWIAYESMPIADNPGEAYTKARLAAMEKGGEVTEPDILALVEDGPMVMAGKAAFVRNCSKCNGAQGEGKEGPNLTDNFWLYGGNTMDIYNTIANGTKKGMPDWGPKLGKGACKQLTAYVLTLRNTNVKGKPAQGEEWIPAPPSPPEDVKQ